MGKVLGTVARIATGSPLSLIDKDVGRVANQIGMALLTLGNPVAGAAVSAVSRFGQSQLARGPSTSAAPGEVDMVPPPGLHPTAGCARNTFCFPVEEWPDPEISEMAPVTADGRVAEPRFMGQRYALQPSVGVCMTPSIPGGKVWKIVDRLAPIRRGDLFVIATDDMADYLKRSGSSNKSASALAKRFIGIDPTRRVVVFECTNPPMRIETGIDRVLYAYRVAGWRRTWWRALMAQVELIRSQSRL